MSPQQSDPRVYFAGERTFLAWVRSGITLMALGFVIAKFGFIVDLISQGQGSTIPQNSSLVTMIDAYGTNYLGVLVLLIGVFIILIAQFNHQAFVKSLPAKDVPQLPITWLAALLTYTMGLAGILLSLYLLLI